MGPVSCRAPVGHDTICSTDRSLDDPITSALESLLDRFGGMVRQIGFRYDLSGAELDEMIQEVRIRIWRAKRESEKIAQVPSSYVYAAARSAAVDLTRRRRTNFEGTSERCASLRNAWTVRSCSAIRPDEALEAKELLAILARNVATLPASRQSVIRLYLAGYGREEIAAQMGWSEAKTRNLLYRGLAQMRESLHRKPGRA